MLSSSCSAFSEMRTQEARFCVHERSGILKADARGFKRPFFGIQSKPKGIPPMAKGSNQTTMSVARPLPDDPAPIESRPNPPGLTQSLASIRQKQETGHYYN